MTLKERKSTSIKPVGGAARGTKRRIERRAQELWFERDADRRAFSYK
jgi:hypothetical protein